MGHLDSELGLTYANMSKAGVLNKLYATKLKRGGRLLIARLLNAIARSEEIHARRALMYIRGKMGDSSEYVENLLARKKDDAEAKYPKISVQLHDAGKKKAAEAFDQFSKVAKVHLKLLKEVLEENVYDLTTYYVCQICGYIAVEEVPLNCPVCNAIREKFRIEE